MAPLACAVEVTDVGADICIQTESLARSYERTAAAFTGSRDLSSARADAWIVLCVSYLWRSDSCSQRGGTSGRASDRHGWRVVVTR
jgi:hypothetical protein